MNVCTQTFLWKSDMFCGKMGTSLSQRIIGLLVMQLYARNFRSLLRILK
jgi:hypothetical protein